MPLHPKRKLCRLGVGDLQDAVAHLLLQDELGVLRHLRQHRIKGELGARGDANDPTGAQQIDEILEHGAIEELRGVKAVEHGHALPQELAALLERILRDLAAARL